MSAAGKGLTFLLEIGTEEIPARMLAGAIADLTRGLQEKLAAAGLAPAAAHGYGTPRRMATLFEGLPARQADQTVEVVGPAVGAAYDAAGKPTKAAEGFARAQGVGVETLRRVKGPKGECVGLLKEVRGREVGAILAETVPAVVSAMTFPKTMRWGSGEHRFVRPVHSVVALLDATVVDLALFGVRSGRDSFGHRASGPARVPIAQAGDYLGTLRGASVLADPAERRAAIARGLHEAARAAGASIATPPGIAGTPENPDPELLAEVTDLVEWPHVLCGSIETDFMGLPGEILLTSMRHHQKYFALQGKDGSLVPKFLAVANVRDDADGTIRRGNEWVLRARLSDARFFWEEDRKTPLDAVGAALARVAFHEKLGSYAAKRDRIVRLAGTLVGEFAAAGLKPESHAAVTAAGLAKNDLTTQMVNEFPELEGVVGGLYARADGLPEKVATAIYDHYLPRALDGPAPSTLEGAVVALADRLDTQAGIFLLGLVPTGSRDPYALRRSVQGVVRILVERGVPLSLRTLLTGAVEAYAGAGGADAVPTDKAIATLLEFYTGRQEYLGVEAGLRLDSVRAALAAGCDDPCDARRRMTALDAFRDTPGFDDLAAAHKRIKNILSGQKATATFDPARLKDAAERTLVERLAAARPKIEAATRARDYGAALAAMAALREPLDRFFAEVMVLAEDAALRVNRVALLDGIARLFLGVADFSEIAAPAAAQTRKEA
ncbi:MAG TPA: glycine--tRNA ligase subunit beta [Candidatus Polarisedimenticolia bacterium]|nr:glycine--tRNA ligase subunit beta [Candidatus Polarisedimenticolia bacterium]